MNGSIPSKLIIMILLTVLCFTQINGNKDAALELSEIVRHTVNKVAGKEIIPSDTVFELKGVHGSSTSSSVRFPDGGYAALSQYSYSTNSSRRLASESIILIISILLSIVSTALRH